MAVTIRDIAKYAETSIATISRVLNNSPDVNENTRRKVKLAIEELGYAPPVIAKGFSKNKLKTIGLLIPDINNMYYPGVIKGIENTLAKEDYNIFLCNTDEDIEKEKKYIETLLNKNVEGIMFLGTRPTGNNDHLLELSNNIPVLMINDYIIGSNIYSVMIDEVEGAYKAVDYLIRQGHRKIAFINGDVDYTTYRYKRRGYDKALNDHNIDLDESLIIKEDPHEDGGYRGVKKLFDLEEQPTAIFTASDQIAIGVIKGIYENSLTIPGDYSIIGFSDIPIAKQLYPELTTVNQFADKTGNMAAIIMMKLIANETMEQKRFLLEPKLSIRNSCRNL